MIRDQPALIRHRARVPPRLAAVLCSAVHAAATQAPRRGHNAGEAAQAGPQAATEAAEEAAHRAGTGGAGAGAGAGAAAAVRRRCGRWRRGRRIRRRMRLAAGGAVAGAGRTADGAAAGLDADERTVFPLGTAAGLERRRCKAALLAGAVPGRSRRAGRASAAGHGAAPRGVRRPDRAPPVRAARDAERRLLPRCLR